MALSNRAFSWEIVPFLGLGFPRVLVVASMIKIGLLLVVVAYV